MALKHWALCSTRLARLGTPKATSCVAIRLYYGIVSIVGCSASHRRIDAIEVVGKS